MGLVDDRGANAVKAASLLGALTLLAFPASAQAGTATLTVSAKGVKVAASAPADGQGPDRDLPVSCRSPRPPTRRSSQAQGKLILRKGARSASKR